MKNEFLDYGDVIVKIEPPDTLDSPIQMVAPFQGLVKIFHGDGRVVKLSWEMAKELSERIQQLENRCHLVGR